MQTGKLHLTLNIFIAGVWLVNGLVCKLLNLVPRHRQIVAAILGERYAFSLVMIIGSLEIGMVIWILCGIRSRLNAIFQMVIIAVMNIIECSLVPELLLWGRL